MQVLPPVGLEQPDQLVNLDPVVGVIVSVTVEPATNGVLQLLPQLIPAGVLVIVPLPVPRFVTDKTAVGTAWAKLATTLAFAPRVIAQVGFTGVIVSDTKVAVTTGEQPLKPAKVEPAAGVAVRVITVPLT